MSLLSLRRAVAATAPVLLLGALFSTAATTDAAPTVDTASPVVISEVYGGGGNSGAPLSNDFVELYNSGSASVDLSGWSVQYASASGTSWGTAGASTAPTPLTGSIAPGQLYLVQEAAGAATGLLFPVPDATGTLAMSGTSGKVALVNTTTPLSGCATVCSTTAGVVDFVGYGAANDSAGGTPAGALSSTTSAQRTIAPYSNTGVNGTDFSVAAPTPKAAPVPPPVSPCEASSLPPECVAGTTTIQDIQGVGFLSPLNNTTVDKVPGIVTAVRATGSRGFWIQQPTRDQSRPAASSGIFVFSSATVAVGDSVLVTGPVKDFYPVAAGETVATTASLSTTEISIPTTVTVVSSGNPLPSPLTITPSTVPARYAPTPDTGNNIELVSPIDPSRSALEFWEAHEGMLVRVDDARVVGPGKPQFGETYVTTKPADQSTPRGGTYIRSYAEPPTGRLLISPLSGSVPAANVGDVLSGATVGPVDWSGFGGYDIAATAVGTRTDNGLKRTLAPAQAPDQLAIATYNVENLAPGDSSDKYARLGAGVVTNLATPDVIAVEEIQDNSGATDDGTVAADATLTKLTDAISAAGGPAYQWAEINPVNDLDGGQPGCNIRSVFLYNPARVALAPGAAGDSTTPVAVSAAPDGTPELSLNPGRVDPANAAWTASRKPLAAQFVFQGKPVIVVANHFNSKGGDQNADGRFQPPNRSSEVQRTQQATVLNAFVKQILAVDPQATVVLAGDFNDYQFSHPVLTLTDNGTTLTDLITTLPEGQRYTYVFNGVSQVLDHIFVTKGVTDVEYDVVHLNAEFADQVSDHDPQLVRIRPAERVGTLSLDPATVTAGTATTVRLAGWAGGATLQVALDGVTVGQVTLDATGAAAYPLIVSVDTAAGGHAVTATAPGGRSASATLSVRAPPALGSVTVIPRTAVTGFWVVVYLDHWAPRMPLAITLDGQIPIGTALTGSGGRALTFVPIPSGTSRGTHRIVVTVADGRSVSTTIRVL